LRVVISAFRPRRAAVPNSIDVRWTVNAEIRLGQLSLPLQSDLSPLSGMDRWSPAWMSALGHSRRRRSEWAPAYVRFARKADKLGDRVYQPLDPENETFGRSYVQGS